MPPTSPQNEPLRVVRRHNYSDETFLPGFFSHFGVDFATNIERDPIWATITPRAADSKSINQTATAAVAAAIPKPTISSVSLVPIDPTARTLSVVGVI